MKSTLAFTSLLLAGAIGLTPVPSRCPSTSEIQAHAVKEHFDDQKLQGLWYELAMIDVTQPRFCDCQISNRTVNIAARELVDDFKIECSGMRNGGIVNLLLSDSRGVSMARWKEIPVVGNIVFPNAVVDFEENGETGEYEWIIEFQCVASDHGVRFFFNQLLQQRIQEYGGPHPHHGTARADSRARTIHRFE